MTEVKGAVINMFNWYEAFVLFVVVFLTGMTTAYFLLTKFKRRNRALLEEVEHHRSLARQYLENSIIFAELMNNLPQRVYLKDSESRYLRCNSVLASDLEIRAEDIAGRSDFDFFPRRIALKYRDDDRRIISHAQPLEQEEEYILPGSSKIVRTIKIPIVDPLGKVICILGISDDITREKETEHNLREKEELFRTLVQQAADAMTLADMKGSIIDANTMACKSLGYTRAELLAHNMKIIDPEVWAGGKPHEVWREFTAGKPMIYESKYHRKDGTSFSVEISMGLLKMSGRNLVLSIARDITPRHLALKQNASMGKIIEDSLSEIYILARDTFSFLQVNRGARENLQYSAEELKTRTISDISPLLTRSDLRELTGDLQTGKKDRVTFKTSFIRRDGSSYPVEVHLQNAEYLFRPVYVVHAEDLTQRKEDEKKLQTAFDIINKSSSVAFIWNNDAHWSVRFVSNNVEKIFGFSMEDFLSHRLFYARIIHPEDLEKVRSEIAAASIDTARNNINHLPYRVITGSNEVKWVSVQTYISRNAAGEILSYQGIVDDITALKEQEIVLRIKKEEWERTFDAFSDIVTLQDKSMRITRVNKTGSELLNLPPDEIIGKYCYRLFRGIDAPCPECPALESYRTFRPYTKEIYHQKLEKTFLVSTSPVLDENGEILYIAHVAKDITERKMLEKQLFLSQKMTTIAGLAAGVAHEINTPLSAILQSIHVVENSLIEDSPVNRRTAVACGVDLAGINEYFKRTELDFFLHGIRESAVNASRIISSLLDFSRPRQGDMVEADINRLIDNSLELARADYDLKKKYDILNVEVGREYTSGLPPVRCVPMEIEQVLLNLLKNAVHAMTDGPVREGKPRLTIRTYRQDASIYIEIEDNGPGVRDDIKQSIFDPFFTTKDIGIGTGLGLSVSYTIINEKHGGNLWVESETGKGATFKICLPAGKAQT